VQYDLELLEEIITVTLDPKKILQQKIDDALFTQLHGIAVTEHGKIRKRLKLVHYSHDKERLKEQYVQQQQADIIALMNKVDDYLMPLRPHDFTERDKETNLEKLYKRIFHLLQDLLEFIEKHLSKYFNLDLDVPVCYLTLSQTELRLQLKRIKRKLLDDKTAKDIAEFILTPISQVSSIQEQVSYRKFLYTKELMRELEGLPLTSHAQLDQEEGPLRRNIINKDSITELLYYMNFNCSKLLQSLIAEVVQTINSIHDQREKLAWLYEFNKELQQLQVKPSVKLVAETRGLRDSMASWIEEEIYCLEKRESLFTVMPTVTETIKDEDKIHFSVAEPVLSLIARSALDAKLVLNKVKKKVFETTAKMITTPGTNNPKPGALLKKGYDPERVHKEKAIGILHDMIRWIMKY
jgi:hypothetical protein